MTLLHWVSPDRVWMTPALPAAFAALLTAGCGSAPPVELPDLRVETPEQWTGAPGVGEGVELSAPDSAAASWWRAFGDPRLDELVAEALAGNPDLAVAAARVDAAAAQARIAGADVTPQLNAGATASRSQNVLIGIPIPTAGDGPIKTRPTSFGVSLDVSWEADLWGRARSGKSAAAADLAAAFADYEGARLSLAGQTLKAHFATVEAAQQLALAERTAMSTEKTLRLIRARYEKGLRPSLDVRLARTDRATAAAALAQRREIYDRARRGLEILLGRYPAGAIEPGRGLPPPPAAVPAGLPADLLRRRPDLVAAERRFAASGRRVAQAKASLLPRLRLTASGGRTSQELADLLDGDFTVWSLVANLLQPVFQGGRLRGQVDLTEALADQAVAAYAGQALRAFAEVETGLRADVTLAEQERALALAADEALAAFRLAESRYANGIADAITLLSAQRAAAQAESRLLEVRRRRLDARVDLHLALGGGFALPAPAPGAGSNATEKGSS